MIKTVFLLLVTLVLIYFGLGLISEDINIPRQDVFSWTGIVFVVYFLERVIKYVLKLPLKHYFEELRKHPLAKFVQDSGFTMSYILLWLGVGITPINAVVAGNFPDYFISNLVFFKISIVLIIATLVFSTLWWVSLKIKK